MNSTEHAITLVRTIEAAADRVYAAWTEVPAMALWLGQVAADIRPGGAYRFESPAPNGRSYVYTGRYLALEPGQRVAQSFLAGEPDGDIPYSNEFIEVRLRALGPGRTELTFTNGWDGEALTAEGVDAASRAWSDWLDRMAASVLTGAMSPRP